MPLLLFLAQNVFNEAQGQLAAVKNKPALFLSPDFLLAGFVIS
jgi:hypothetical protein